MHGGSTPRGTDTVWACWTWISKRPSAVAEPDRWRGARGGRDGYRSRSNPRWNASARRRTLLINNAGILRTGPLIDHAVEDFSKVVQVNLVSVFIVSQIVARRMKDNGGGAIVNLASINAIHPAAVVRRLCGGGKRASSASRSTCRMEWGGYGIRVNSMAPGFIDAGMAAPFYRNPAITGVARQCRAPGEASARRTTWPSAPCSWRRDAAAYISGQNIAIDGGVINSVLAQLPRE